MNFKCQFIYNLDSPWQFCRRGLLIFSGLAFAHLHTVQRLSVCFPTFVCCFHLGGLVYDRQSLPNQTCCEIRFTEKILTNHESSVHYIAMQETAFK